MNCYGRMVLLALVIWMPGASLPLLAQPTSTTAPAANPPTKATTTAQAKLSQAERIVRLEQAIEAGTKEMEGLKASLSNPESEYAKAKADFTRLDKRLKEREKELASQPAPADGQNLLAGLVKARELAKERFDLAIKANNNLQSKYASLQEMLRQNQEVLAGLRGPASRPASTQPVTVQPTELTTTVDTPTAVPKTPAPVASVETAAPAQSQPAPSLTASPPQAKSTGSTGVPVTQSATEQTQNRKDIQEALQKTQAQDIQVRKAELDAQSVTKRIVTLRDAIDNEQQLLENARKQAQNARDSYANLRESIQKLLSTGAPTEQVNRLWTKVNEAEKRATDTDAEVDQHVASLDRMKSDLLDLQTEQNEALKTLEQKQTDATQAKEQLKSLTNPFSAHNVLQWLIDHGPRILGIILGGLLLLWSTRVAEHRIVKLMTLSRAGDGTIQERESRATTLASVFRNVASTVIICGGILMILTEVGLNIVPLLGGAAVFGLAVAFGAQSLIKDYFNGFMILLENHYAINDEVKIGDITGTVERITLRMTMLRGADGSANFIPHGEVHKVINMTHGWARAVFDIGIGYKENVDEVMGVLVKLGKQMRQEPAYSQYILEDPEMLGVEEFGDSAVVIKFNIKTRALKRLVVKREMLRRIKNRFDELGIEIPYPHQVVYNRSDDGLTPEDKDTKS